MHDSVKEELIDSVKVDLHEIYNGLKEELKNPPKKPVVMVCGQTGSGKTSLIKSIMGDMVSDEAIGAGLPVTKGFKRYGQTDGGNIIVWDSKGFEVGQTEESYREELTRFLKDEGKDVHLIWYVIQGDANVTDFDRQVVKEVLPFSRIVVVVTKSDIMKNCQKENLKKHLTEWGIECERIVFTRSGETFEPQDENRVNGCKELVDLSIQMLPEACRDVFIQSQVQNIELKVQNMIDRILKKATRPLFDWAKVTAHAKTKVTDIVEGLKERIPWTVEYAEREREKQEREQRRKDVKRKTLILGVASTFLMILLWRILGCFQEGHWDVWFLILDALCFIGMFCVGICVTFLLVCSFKKSSRLGWSMLATIAGILSIIVFVSLRRVEWTRYSIDYWVFGCLKYLVFFWVPACCCNLFFMLYGKRFEEEYKDDDKDIDDCPWKQAWWIWFKIIGGWIFTSKYIFQLIQTAGYFNVASAASKLNLWELTKKVVNDLKDDIR